MAFWKVAGNATVERLVNKGFPAKIYEFIKHGLATGELYSLT
jgi:hypothetical protein